MRISKNIYPSSFSNVRCLTKIEFLNVVKHRWKSQGAEPWCRLRSGGGGGGEGRGGEVSEKFWPFLYSEEK